MGLFFVWFWLSFGGFAYQAMTHHNWERAFITSWDQGAALLAVWLVSIVRSKLSSHQGNCK
jgi:hypothetical protein